MPNLHHGQPVLHAGELVEHCRVLDLRQGILFRTWRQRLPSGTEVTFRSARFASLADRGILAMEAEALWTALDGIERERLARAA